jgi:hypothetical protein
LYLLATKNIAAPYAAALPTTEIAIPAVTLLLFPVACDCAVGSKTPLPLPPGALPTLPFEPLPPPAAPFAAVALAPVPPITPAAGSEAPEALPMMSIAGLM